MTTIFLYSYHMRELKSHKAKLDAAHRNVSFTFEQIEFMKSS